jgi:hypothetical protein
MPMVYIECPVTHNLLPTNHILPDTEKLKVPISRNLLIACPYCNTTHAWNDHNGFFLKPGEIGCLINGVIEV